MILTAASRGECQRFEPVRRCRRSVAVDMTELLCSAPSTSTTDESWLPARKTNGRQPCLVPSWLAARPRLGGLQTPRRCPWTHWDRPIAVVRARRSPRSLYAKPASCDTLLRRISRSRFALDSCRREKNFSADFLVNPIVKSLTALAPEPGRRSFADCHSVETQSFAPAKHRRV